jgi:membrane dipeptidase
MKEGKVGGQFWSVFVECPDIVHLDDPSHTVRDTFEQIDVAKRMISDYDELYYCESSACVTSAFKKGKFPSMLGAEGLHQAGSSIAIIRQLYNAGVRYITITHNCDNPFATAASTVTEFGKDAGLTDFGADAILEMNRLGMMVDLSHTSHKSMRQILDITQSPVIFSHAACYSLAKNYRNAPDDVIARLKTNGGVLMLMFVKRFLNAQHPEDANIETAVDHIMHVVKVAGWDHIGIGADFDGTVTLANGLSSVADYPKLVEAVMRRGATDEQVRKLVGENILRYVLYNNPLHI